MNDEAAAHSFKEPFAQQGETIMDRLMKSFLSTALRILSAPSDA